MRRLRSIFYVPLLAAAVLVALPFTPAQARVFQSLGRAPYQPAGSHPAWTRAQASAWTFNGGHADVEVWSVEESVTAAVHRMREQARREGAIAVFLPGHDMAWGAVGHGGRMARILCTASESGRQTLVFVFSQTESDFRRSLAGPADRRLPGALPIPPGARLRFTAVNRDNGASFAVLTAGGSPAGITDYLASSLRNDGWTPAAGTAGPLAVFLRPGALCAFNAKLSGTDGSVTVTMVYRRLDAGDAP
jgi:hypothetical protein